MKFYFFYFLYIFFTNASCFYYECKMTLKCCWMSEFIRAIYHEQSLLSGNYTYDDEHPEVLALVPG